MRARSISELFRSGVLMSAILARMSPEDQEKLAMKANGNGDLEAKVQKILADAARKISVLCNSQVGNTDGDSMQAEPATVAMSHRGLPSAPLFRLTDADRGERPLDFVWRTHGKANPRT